LTATATDLDLGDNARLRYVIGDVTARCATPGCTDDVVKLHVDAHSGQLRAETVLDRETHSQIDVIVLAIDHGIQPQTGSTIVEIVVDDVNDHQPTFLSTGNSNGGGGGGGGGGAMEWAVVENSSVGAVVGRLRAVDGDATPPNNRVSYYFRSADGMSGAKFAVDSGTGEVRVVAPLDREVVASYALTAVAVDGGREGGLSAAQSLIIRVLDTNDNRPTFVFPTPLNNTVAV